MAELLTSISRSDTIPIIKSISADSNKGYISVDTSKFTPQMFYELPAIKFEIYTETNGERVKYKSFSRTVRTYEPSLYLHGDMIITMPISNIPASCYLYITPIFDNDSVPARNMLIENGIETGDLWDIIPTATFPITIGFDDQAE